jgi:hypothetical protein
MAELAERTTVQLETADRNRSIAREVLKLEQPQPPPYEWVAVVAFYAAVHYVNAYLWERQRFEPADHEERQQAVNFVVALAPTLGAYSRLRRIAYEARYLPGYRIHRGAARSLLEGDLAFLRNTVIIALANT